MRSSRKKNNGNFTKHLLNYIYAAAAVILISVTGYFGYRAYNYLFFKKRVFILKKISITGKGITYREKIKIIKQSNLSKNENLLDVDLKRVSRLIASDRWIKDVTVYKKYPDKIIIVLKKRKTFAMVVNNNNLYYISRSGYVIGKANYGTGYNYPVITGLSKDNAVSYFKKLSKALYFLKIAKSSVISNLIGEVHIEKDNGIGVYTVQGLYIKFGIGGYKNKLKTLKRLFYEINKIHIKYKPYINLEYKNEAVIEVNQGSRVLPADYKNTVIPTDVFK
ncbi:MAG: cell division protein FtsQ/DivIB [bacterium]